MYVFSVGERKEVWFRVSSRDGSPFSHTGTYAYKGDSGEVLGTGQYETDSQDGFVLLEPTIPGSYHYVEVSCAVTPLDADGQPDLTKNVQIIEGVIQIIVNP